MSRRIYPQDPLKTLRECEGYYECPRDSRGKRLGPLVGYAGKYDSGNGVMKAFVGEVYYNFAAAEESPIVLFHFGGLLGNKLRRVNIKVDAVLGAPMGGLLLAGALGFNLEDSRILFAEKKVTAVATESQREQSVLSLDRHQVHPGERVAIVEDVCNNFSTTQQLLELVNNAGGKVVAIATFLNRSSHLYYPIGTTNIPVISVLQVPTEQWRQDDPAVAGDVQANNVAWKPKLEWPRLKVAMEGYAKTEDD